MSEYYIDKEENQDKLRVIHRDDCQELPATPAFSEDLKYLGSYGSKEAAFSKARGYFEDVSYCPNCLS